jgi:hypothetical protein
MSEQQAATPATREQQRKALTIVAMAMGGASLILLIMAGLMLVDFFGMGESHSLIGMVLAATGFLDLGIAWFMFNKAQSIR